MKLHLPPWLASRRASAEEAVILLDAGGRIVGLDAAAEGLAHGGTEPPEGRSFESVFRVRDEEGGELSADTRRIVLTTSTGEKRFELIAAPRGGEYGWRIVLRAYPVPLVAGEEPGAPPPESAARYRALLNSVHAGFCVLRVLFDGEGVANDYRFLEVNPAFEVQTGFENAVGKTARELVPNLDRSWPELYGKIAVTGEPMHFHQEEDALGRSYDVYAFRLGGEESRDVTLLFTDVTAHKVAEATIREAHERIATILENITDAYFGLDEGGRFTYLNREAQRLLDLASDDLVGVSIWEAFPGLRGSPFEPFYRNALAGIAGSITEFYPDHNRYYEVHASPTGTGIAVSFRDASEQVRNEEERERLWQSVLAERRKLELAYAESPAFVAILRGRDLVFEYANNPYYELIGHREILNRPLAEALPETVAQGFPELLLRVMDTGERLDIPELLCLLQREPGAPLEERFVTLRYLPAREADGTISGVYAHGIDVTEMILARRALAERVEESAR